MMKRALIIGLLILPGVGMWLAIQLLVMNPPFSIDPPFDFLVSISLTFIILLVLKIILDLLHAAIDIYRKERIVTLFPLMFIKRKKLNIRFSPYFSFHRKSLLQENLKDKILSSFFLVGVILVAVILQQPILLIVLNGLFLWNIMDINHLMYNPMEFLFNEYRWEKTDSFEVSLKQTLQDRIQKSELSYADFMPLLLYDVVNQCTFLTDSDLFEDILDKIVDSRNLFLCIGLVELLIYEMSICNNHKWFEKAEKIRMQLIRINQLDFFFYTGWLLHNFEVCMNHEYDKIKTQKISISSKKII